MKKTFAKIVIILALAFGIGRALVQYTQRGKDYYSTMKAEFKVVILDILDAEPKHTDLDPYLKTPSEEFSELYSGSIVGTGQEVDATILQERLEYYRTHKDSLWND